MDWARLTVRGSPSRLIAVTPALASWPASSGSASGRSRPMSAWPDRSRAISSGAGAPTPTSTSAPPITSSRLATFAPARS